MKKFFILFSVLILATSCASKKEIIYFQDADGLNDKLSDQNFEPIIETNDILYVAISSIDEAVIAPFKRNTGLEGNITNSNAGLQGYLVNVDGTINFPVIGDVSVAGKTRGQVKSDLRAALSEYITDVVVDVRIMNFKITVLGEVNAPGVYTIQDERVTLPEALGLAGDLSEDGKRENIMVIRKVNGKQQVAHVDLTKTDFFSSPFYFLKQNDVVYVQPSLKGVKKSGFIPDIPALLSVVTIILSSIILLTR
ncbi:MAG: polysaccharide biosynthesis/export family protein [Flavobacteriaceae bacterium]|nr:polysaccharide biosynthesis/export family protein [Flavobacteriaceae bacterium]